MSPSPPSCPRALSDPAVSPCVGLYPPCVRSADTRVVTLVFHFRFVCCLGCASRRQSSTNFCVRRSPQMPLASLAGSAEIDDTRARTAFWYGLDLSGILRDSVAISPCSCIPHVCSSFVVIRVARSSPCVRACICCFFSWPFRGVCCCFCRCVFLLGSGVRRAGRRGGFRLHFRKRAHAVLRREMLRHSLRCVRWAVVQHEGPWPAVSRLSCRQVS